MTATAQYGAGAIGAPLDATIEVWCDAQQYPRFSALGDEMRFALIRSQVNVTRVDGPPDGAVPAPTAAASGVWISVKPNDDAKCVRCWQRRRDVGTNAEHPQLCARCATNVAGSGETRKYA